MNKNTTSLNILIKNGYVVDPANGLSGTYDILIENGIIKEVSKSITIDKDFNQYDIIDATGLLVSPGLVDMHVHLRDPGFTHKEDIITGCIAAVSGGITSVLCMPNTKPVIDNAQTITYINEKAKQSGSAHVYICGAITTQMSGTGLADFEMYKNMGVVAVSDDGRPVANALIMKEALKEATKQNLLTISHCEDLDLIDGGIINEGEVSVKLGVKGMDRASEDYVTAREVYLANSVDSKIHIAHVSTKGSTQFIKFAKDCGYKVTAETAPHYFWYTEDKLLSKDANYRMNPPLRCSEDVNAIINGIKDGTFDCIITDHAPHSIEEKSDFYTAPNGVIGMETSFAASFTKLVKQTNSITIEHLIKLVSTNPANLLGIPAGNIGVGKQADIAIFDLQKEFTVDAKNAHGKSSNVIFNGETLFGQTKYTIVNGNIVFKQ